jgi:hypothetical protein
MKAENSQGSSAALAASCTRPHACAEAPSQSTPRLSQKSSCVGSEELRMSLKKNPATWPAVWRSSIVSPRAAVRTVSQAAAL